MCKTEGCPAEPWVGEQILQNMRLGGRSAWWWWCYRQAKVSVAWEGGFPLRLSENACVLAPSDERAALCISTHAFTNHAITVQLLYIDLQMNVQCQFL